MSDNHSLLAGPASEAPSSSRPARPLDDGPSRPERADLAADAGGRSAFRGEPFEAVRTTTHKLGKLGRDGIRPGWSSDRLPTQVLTPLDSHVAPIKVDAYVVRPQDDLGIVYVSPSQVALLSFSLTVRRTARADGSIAISGGSAIFSLTVYEPGSLEKVASLRQDWSKLVRASLVREKEWSYQAEPRRGLRVWLELPAGVAASEPLIVTSALAGVASVAVELTESGTLAWKAALEQGAGSSVPGVVHVTTASPAVDDLAVLRLDRRTLDTPVGTLLAGCGPTDIHYVDPQLTLQGTLVVVTGELVDRSTVAVLPNQNQAPVSRVFDAAGGQVQVAVTTQDVSAVEMDWSAQVAFTPLGWPVVPTGGRLDVTNIWSEMIKPESWCASYLVMAVAVNDRGETQPVESGAPQLQGVLNFTAPYVGNGLLNSSFYAPYLSPVNVALPRYPGQPFGTLVLTVFASRNGVAGTGSRTLGENELNVVVLVYPDARVEIRTSSDSLPETSSIGEALTVLEALG